MGNIPPGRRGPFSGGPFGPPRGFGQPGQDTYQPPGPYAAPDRTQIETFPYQNPNQPLGQGYPDTNQNVGTQFPQQNPVSLHGTQQGYQQGYGPQAYQHQAYPPQLQQQYQSPPPGYPPPGYPQSYPQQGYPYQQYPQPQAPSMAQTTFCAACMACLTCLMCSCCQGLLGMPADDSIAESAGTTGGTQQVSPPSTDD